MRPDDLLHIYELEGPVSQPEGFFKDDLLAHWREGESHFLFFSSVREKDLKGFLKKHAGVSWVRTHEISYGQWQGGEILESLTMGELLFVPPWAAAPQDREKKVIRLDPGVVFGSGQHPTTRDCLQALLWIYGQGQRPRRVLDLGSGTGVLSLAAVFLGAETVLAVDWNPACVRTTEKNVSGNGLEGRIEVAEGRAEEFIREPADLVMANLHLAVLREVIEDRGFQEKKWAVLSGLLRSEFLEIKDRLKRSGFEILREWDADFTWFTLAGRNRGEP